MIAVGESYDVTISGERLFRAQAALTRDSVDYLSKFLTSPVFTPRKPGRHRKPRKSLFRRSRG